MAQVRHLIGKERKKLEEGLLELGCQVFLGKANYILFLIWESEREAEKTEPLLYQAMLAKGILIRDCRNYKGLSGGYYRICVGKEQDNQRVLQSLSEYQKERAELLEITRTE